MDVLEGIFVGVMVVLIAVTAVVSLQSLNKPYEYQNKVFKEDTIFEKIKDALTTRLDRFISMSLRMTDMEEVDRKLRSGKRVDKTELALMRKERITIIGLKIGGLFVVALLGFGLLEVRKLKNH